MLNLDVIFADSDQTPTITVPPNLNAANAKPAALAARSQAAMIGDESQVVESTTAPTAVVANDAARHPPEGRDCGTVPNGASGIIAGGPPASETKSAAHAHAREAEPQSCPTCGCPIYWLLPTGNVGCGNCAPRPKGAICKLIVVTAGDGRMEWSDYAAERKKSQTRLLEFNSSTRYNVRHDQDHRRNSQGDGIERQDALRPVEGNRHRPIASTQGAQR